MRSLSAAITSWCRACASSAASLLPSRLRRAKAPMLRVISRPIVAEATRPTDQSTPRKGPSSRAPNQTPAAEAMAQI